MGKIIFYIVLGVIVIAVACTVWPFFSKSRINYDLKEAALYGTKHTIGETRKFLTKALEERAVSYDPENLIIEKDEKNTVTITLFYEDTIHFFGIVIKELEFELEVQQKNVTAVF